MKCSFDQARKRTLLITIAQRSAADRRAFRTVASLRDVATTLTKAPPLASAITSFVTGLRGATGSGAGGENVQP